MGLTFSKREKKKRAYYKFVKPWRHEGSSNISHSTGRLWTHCASELSEDDIWQRRSDVKGLGETYSVHQVLLKSENVEIYRETVLNGFGMVDSTNHYHTINEYNMYKDDEETEEYKNNDFELGNKHKSRPQIHVEREELVVVEEEEEEMYEEMYEDPDFKRFNEYPDNILDIQGLPRTPLTEGGYSLSNPPSADPMLKSSLRPWEVSGDESCHANVEAQTPQQPQLEQAQVADEVDITDTEEEEEEAPPLPIRTVGRRHRYEETIILHRQIIVRDVIVSQVLPHMHMCLSSSDISAIKGENDQHKAVELLLDKLSASKEPGKWKMFVQALEESKHKAIVDALRRKSIPDSNELGKFLHIFSPQLREMILPSEITAELLRTNIINSEDRDEIHQKERSAGAVAAADILLDRIPRKHPDWFWNFIGALRIIGRHDLVDMLTERNDIERNTAKQEEEGSVSSNERTDTTKCLNTFKYGSSVLGNEQQTTYESTGYDVNTERNDIERNTAKQEEEGSVSSNERTDTTKCINTFKYGSSVLGNEQQTTYESTGYDVNTENKDLEYSEAYGVLDENKEIQEHCNPGDETLGEKTMKADENVQQSKRKLKYSPVVINGQICTAKDKSVTEEWTPPLGEIPVSQTNRERFLSGCILLTEAQSKNIQLLRENKNALVADGNALELEMLEYEDILNAHEKNNKLLKRKRSFCEQIKIKEKEATALKAALSGEAIEEDQFRYQSAASLEDMAQYIAPGRRPMTWDFRDTDVSATIIPSRIPIGIGITMPVKLYDVDQTYKDSAFYSEY
ncbi:uncharacterized protein LOC123558149 isoform X2 [Mercenaria mercenaria]|uniref:uncharacterized protein LOC123558149 isoform X2 n=1 Tax=Mercenaria mercenaria TaxID=6596 RepID=UPI00234EA845|nr:uncharacterized protein LOC123558149 isoform X2 [Mercenaria mercenaria]